MTFRVTPLTEQINRQEYAAAAQKLAEALAARGGNIAAAGRDIKVDYRTMTRWLATLRAANHDVRAMAAALQKKASSTAARSPLTPRVSRLAGKSPDEQRRIVLDEARKAGGNLATVAREIGCSRQAMYKRVEALGIVEDVDTIRTEAASS